MFYGLPINTRNVTQKESFLLFSLWSLSTFAGQAGACQQNYLYSFETLKNL